MKGHLRLLPFLVCMCLSAGALPAAKPLRVLILDGQNNHDWVTTTPLLKQILTDTGRFSVDVSTAPPAKPRVRPLPKNATPEQQAARAAALEKLPAEQAEYAANFAARWAAWRPVFSDYDVVVSNYNGEDWPAEVRETFVTFVQSGGGFVSYHAANNSFPHWPEYNRMIGLGGWGGRNEKAGPYLRYRDGVWTRDPSPGPGGGHGPQHEFLMIGLTPDHPILRGLPEKWMHSKDELYHGLRGPAEDITVLAGATSDQTKLLEPLLMAIPYGRGRVFHTALGHGPDAIRGLGFQVTFARGVEWAATGHVTLPAPAAADLPATQPGTREVAIAASAQSAPAPDKMPTPPVLSPAESQKLFELPPGYRLELVLSEPDIKEPVVTAFDPNGRMYVAEMRTYMQDIDGTGSKQPDSRVSLHWSSKGDGVFDRHSVFIDGLVLPRILLPLKDSLLVQETDTPDIYEYRDTDGDGVADEKKLFVTTEPRKANLEHQTSGLIWAQDNWLYATYTSTRLRWTPHGVIKEPTAPDGGQWGVAQDDHGKPWFVNAGGELGPINFQQPIVYGGFKARDEFAPGFKEVWPLVPIPDVQGGVKRFRPEEKTLNHFTATCGGEIYRGDRLPADLRGDLLFCEPVGRLIRRAKITVRDGITVLSNAYEKSEFIRSADPYFRPVNLTTAPDGTLYITDMSRGIIQEGNWTREGTYLREVILRYGLEKHIGFGRIWRLVHDGAKPGQAPAMLGETPAQLVTHLTHPNGWWRDTAQKLLVLAQDRSVVPALTTMARTHANPLARSHALWTLEGLGALTPDLVREKLSDADAPVRSAAIRVSETLFKQGDASLRGDILARFEDRDPGVVLQAMMSATLLKWPEAKALIQKTAIASPSAGVKEIAAQILNPLSAQLPEGYDSARPLLERGQQIFMELCFACHGLDARGTPLDGKSSTLAPPLAGSSTVGSHRDALINVLLHGVSGPVHGLTYDAPMVPMGANDDEWVAAIASYIRTGYGNKGSLVSSADVARVRAATATRSVPWTPAELHAQLPRPLDNRDQWKIYSNRLEAPAGESLRLPLTIPAKRTRDASVTIELPETVTLSDVRLACTKTARNLARGYRIELSLDGQTWNTAAASDEADGPVVEVSFPSAPARWIRLTQTKPATNRPWTLDDVVLFQATP